MVNKKWMLNFVQSSDLRSTLRVNNEIQSGLSNFHEKQNGEQNEEPYLDLNKNGERTT